MFFGKPLTICLSWAIYFNWPSIAKISLILGADPNLGSKTPMNPFPDHRPPILDAVYKSRLEIIKTLLKNPKTKKEDIKKALINAIQPDRKFLRPAHPQVFGETTIEEQREILRLLLAFLKNDLIIESRDMNVLHCAAAASNLYAAQAILNSCTSDAVLLQLLQDKNQFGQTPLDFGHNHYLWNATLDDAIKISALFKAKLKQIAKRLNQYQVDSPKPILALSRHQETKSILDNLGIVSPSSKHLGEQFAFREGLEAPSRKLKR